MCPNLNNLELGENDFPANELVHLAGLKELEQLDLHECQIETAEDLVPLKELPNLYVLDISLTTLASKEDFRKQVYETLPNLEILNGVDKEGKIVDIGEDDNISEEEDEDEEEEESNEDDQEDSDDEDENDEDDDSENED